MAKSRPHARTTRAPVAVPRVREVAASGTASIQDRPWFTLAGALLLVLAVFAAYSNTLHAPFVFDDIDSIVENKTLRSARTAFFPPPGSGITVSGRPLLNASLAFNYVIGGDDPAGYHLTNIFIHILAGLALWGLVRRTLQQPVLAERFGSHSTALAWFAAACWCLHPLQTESVTYTIQRAESLGGLFYLLTFYSFIRSTQTQGKIWPFLTVAACWLGMATKEVMVSAPLLVLVYDRTFVSGSFRESWRQRRTLHLALAASWVLLGALIATSGGRGGSVGFSSSVTWWEYSLTQGSAIVRYLQLSVWPHGLVFDYGAFVQKDPLTLVVGIVTVAVLAGGTAWALWKKPAVGFLGLWFFAILAPSSSVIPVITQTMAEHRMYLPLAAVVIPLIVLGYLVAARFHPRIWLIFFLVPLCAGFATFNRNSTYRDAITLWGDSNEAWPDNLRTLNALGVACSEAKKYPEAAAAFAEAVELEPRHTEALSNLGLVLIKLGKKKEGAALLEQAIAQKSDQPVILFNYGNGMLELGNTPAAIAAFEKAVALGLDKPRLHQNLALALDSVGRFQDSEARFQKVIAARPHDAEARIDYARVLRSLKHLPEAKEQLEIALQIDPQSDRAHAYLGSLLISQKQTQAGIAHLRDAIRLRPGSAQAHYLLADALAESGDAATAISHYENVLRLAPPTAHVYNNVGFLYAQLARPIEARDAFREALKLEPNHESARENVAKMEAFLRARSSP